MRTFVTGLVALALAVPAVAGEYNKVVDIGQKAPDFSGIPATFKGQDTSISLSDLDEDVVVLVFLANHCPYVVAAEDHLNDLVDRYEGKSVELVGVCVDQRDSDKLPAIKEWVEKNNSLYTYGYDESQATGKAYGATNTPQFFVLDKDRTIRYMGTMYKEPLNVKPGATNYVFEAVDALLNGEKIETTETKAIGCGIPIRN